MSKTTKIITVAITQRIDLIEGRGETRDAIDQNLVSWVVQAGFLPVIVPNVLVSLEPSADFSVLKAWLDKNTPEALVLSGGNNIGEFHQRDETEKYLLLWAERNTIPVLGICRGMQMMAVWAGADLKKADGHVKTRHRLTSTDINKEWPESVNSYHDWCLKSCPSKFHVLAYSEGGDIEAMEHSRLPWQGWMWHPERESFFNESDISRIKRLFNGK